MVLLRNMFIKSIIETEISSYLVKEQATHGLKSESMDNGLKVLL